jgi:pimeloyl-ACP methyl ester carboxylesterase
VDTVHFEAMPVNDWPDATKPTGTATMTTATTTIHTIDIPGGTLRFEVRGAGPVLFLLGAPMAAADFGTLADALAGDHTVVTQDPRGISGSRLDDPEQDSTPELRADDAAAVLDALGVESADVFGSSGGAVTGLALIARHPGRVKTLVAHEPPLLELLPDAAEQRAGVEDTIATFHRDGLGAAWMKFMAVITAGGAPEADDYAAEPDQPQEQHEEHQEQGQPSEQAIADGRHFFVHEMRGTTRYLPDIPALTSGRSRVVVGVGAGSAGLVTRQTSIALAHLLGTTPVEFPGDHAGFMGQPTEFAAVLLRLLRTAPETA